MKSTLARITFFSFLFLLFIPHFTSAEIKTFIKEYTYQASEMDSKLSCRTIALEQVKRLLLEEVGTYLESQTEVKDFRLTKDQILTLTAGVVRTEIIDERWDGDNLKYWLKAKIRTDPDGVVKSIDDLRKDRQLVRDLEASRTKSDQLLKEIEVLKTKSVSRNSSKNVTDKEYYNKSINKLVADDWGEKGRLLARSNKYTEAIACFDKAI
jgi:hypothetical protein